MVYTVSYAIYGVILPGVSLGQFLDSFPGFPVGHVMILTNALIIHFKHHQFHSSEIEITQEDIFRGHMSLDKILNLAGVSFQHFAPDAFQYVLMGCIARHFNIDEKNIGLIFCIVDYSQIYYTTQGTIVKTIKIQ